MRPAGVALGPCAVRSRRHCPCATRRTWRFGTAPCGIRGFREPEPYGKGRRSYCVVHLTTLAHEAKRPRLAAR